MFGRPVPEAEIVKRDQGGNVVFRYRTENDTALNLWDNLNVHEMQTLRETFGSLQIPLNLVPALPRWRVGKP